MALADLTKYESLARNQFMDLMIHGYNEPIESYDGSTTNNVGPPAWFDEQKFDLGREYFMKNRFGILCSNICGLVLLLSIPKSLSILRATKQSSTPDTARKRYIYTIIHTLSWYEVELKKDSKSWESLQRVRKYHWFASNYGQDQKIGFISQTEVSMTTFGFAGLALIRPYLFGINYADQKERKAFLHFWAVLGHLLGLKDRYNICLLPIKAAEIEFDIIMRNVLSPYVQLETLAFKEMVNAMLVGLSPDIPFNNIDSQTFLLKRALGTPGYQLDVNYTREVPYGNIFSASDVAEIKRHVPKFSEKIQVYKVKKLGSAFSPASCESFYKNHVDPYNFTQFDAYFSGDTETLKKLMGLPCEAEIKIIELNRGPSYLKHLSAKEFYKLDRKAQFNVNIYLAVVSLLKYPRGVTLVNQIMDARIDRMRNKTTNGVCRINPNKIYPEEYIRGRGV